MREVFSIPSELYKKKHSIRLKQLIFNRITENLLTLAKRRLTRRTKKVLTAKHQQEDEKLKRNRAKL
jgi:hypothetical protein